MLSIMVLEKMIDSIAHGSRLQGTDDRHGADAKQQGAGDKALSEGIVVAALGGKFVFSAYHLSDLGVFRY